MSVIGSLVGTVTTEISGWSSGLNKATNQTKEFAGKNGGILKSLNASIGKKSTLGQINKIFKGGGAASVVSAIGNELNDATENARKLFNEFKQGKASVTDVINGLGEALPIFGGFYKWGQQLYGFYDDWANGQNSVNNKMLAMNKIIDDQKKIFAGLKAFSSDYDSYLADSGEQILKNAGKWTAANDIYRRGEEIKKKLREDIASTTDKKTRDDLLGKIAGIDNVTAKLIQSDKSKVSAYHGGVVTGTQFGQINGSQVFQASIADPITELNGIQKGAANSLKQISSQLEIIAKTPVKKVSLQ